MSLSPDKKEILETLSRWGKSMNAVDLAREAKKELRPVRGHLLGLLKMGYVTQPEKALYAITEKGKEALCQPVQSVQPEITKEKAEALLAYAPHDKAFHFYSEVGKPLNVYAHGIRDFANKVERVDLQSLSFHMKRGDFEAWFNCLGDADLAKKIAALKEKNLTGEDLRSQLHQIVEQRHLELAKLAGQPFSTE